MNLTNPLPFWRRYFSRITKNRKAWAQEPLPTLIQLMQWDLSYVEDREYRRRL